jgi:hypothetical protein
MIDNHGKEVDADFVKNIRGIDPKSTIAVVGRIQPIRSALLAEFESSPDKSQTFRAEAARQIDWFTVSIDADAQIVLDATIQATDLESAQKLPATFQAYREHWRDSIQAAKVRAQETHYSPAQQSLDALAQEAIGNLDVQVSGSRVRVRMKRPKDLSRWPELLMARDVSEVSHALLEHGEEMAVAVQNFKKAFAKLPHDITSESGERLLSWRVALMPMFDPPGTWDRWLNLKREPWDSPHNLMRAAEYSPGFYTTPHTPFSETTWKWVGGEPAGILIIDAGRGKSVQWTKPEDFKIDPADPLASLGEEPEYGYVVVFVDGTVKRYAAKELVAMIKGETSRDGSD